LELRRRIAAAADGNPLFAEEFVSMLIDQGSLRRHDGEWAAADRLEVSVPASIQALLAARLDQLDAPERIVGERASVEGTVSIAAPCSTCAGASCARRSTRSSARCCGASS
jgi:predicted ATPase